MKESLEKNIANHTTNPPSSIYMIAVSKHTQFNRPPRFNDDGQQQQQTGNMGGVGGGNGGGGGNQHHQGGGGGGPMRGGMQRPWDRRDDNSFQNKRRRF